MKITNMTPNNFKGTAELLHFRKESKAIIEDYKKIDCPFDYIAVSNEDSPSFQTRLKKLLFKDVKTVGKNYATENDEKMLLALKNIYKEQEEIQDYYNSTILQQGRYRNRFDDVLDITF